MYHCSEQQINETTITPDRDADVVAVEIRVKGIVQGVGFRPFVWQQAQQLQITGCVLNDGQGVLIKAWGTHKAIATLQKNLVHEAPPLARINSIDIIQIDTDQIPEEFTIQNSVSGEIQTDISPDTATCPACLSEINDPENRRYRYPFTNCTHCGPRFSIITAIPYDRKNTSMQSFTMCTECRKEYENPSDRRFHAQPNACPDCGPAVWIEDMQGRRVQDQNFSDDIAHAADLLVRGHILAIRGIGGFHLACDATNPEAVNRLRQRKHRYHKPFALMARDLSVIRQYAKVTDAEEQLLQDRAAPVVLLTALDDGFLADGVAPEQNTLGFMLPYTPLHTLLLQDVPVPLVMTSGNRSDEAQCIANEDAQRQLQGIADFFLLHDREIVNRLDDSVARVVDDKVQVLRRARGYAPLPVNLPAGFEQSPAILGMGAELKNTFCLLKNGKAILSQHQGDLEDVSVFEDYKRSIQLYQEVYQQQVAHIVIDRHPEYLSTKFGQQLAAENNIYISGVQHHHAHIAACMAEHGLERDCKPVMGIAFDGLGYGDDGEIWGGEFLYADYREYRRVASLQAVAMPGASRAIKEPWRNAFAHLHQAMGWESVVSNYPDLEITQFVQAKPVSNLVKMLDSGLNSPSASSAGRLFDAVAAVLGLCIEQQSYEGQAALGLQVLAERAGQECSPYRHNIEITSASKLFRVNWHMFWRDLLDDMINSVPREIIAMRFHQTVICIIHELLQLLCARYQFENVVLTGGVFQNRVLLEGVSQRLREQGMSVLFPQQIPANDGGIAFGQAVVAAARELAGINRA